LKVRGNEGLLYDTLELLLKSEWDPEVSRLVGDKLSKFMFSEWIQEEALRTLSKYNGVVEEMLEEYSITVELEEKDFKAYGSRL